MSDGPFRIDLHVHTEASHDGHEPVGLVLEHAAAIGLDGVVVTDHDFLRRVTRRVTRGGRARPRSRARGDPRRRSVDRRRPPLRRRRRVRPEPGRPLSETIGAVRDLGGAAAIPHPFQRSRPGVRKRRTAAVDPDAIEVYNSMPFTGYSAGRKS